jgi:hypothetical protein
MITSVDLLRQPNYFRFCMFKDYILIETTEVTGTGVNNSILFKLVSRIMRLGMA